MLRSTYLHSGWEFAEEGWIGENARVGAISAVWLPAQVPGHVHLDLVENGVIADPFVRMNELGCQWVDEKTWVYRTSFEFHPDESLPRRLLRFEGLDTIATVTLNGEEIGRSDNMFVPMELDVTGKLLDGTNELQVRFESAVVEGLKRRAAYLEKEGLPPDTAGLFDRSFVRKAQYMFGWDWGPRLVSCGIWKPVRLIEYAARILDVHVMQHWQEDGSVEVHVNCETEGEGQVFFAVLGPGGPEAATESNSFRIDKPSLWWPNGMGDQATYIVSAQLVGEPGSGEQRILDLQSVSVGLRTVKLLREPDASGESFVFEINGKRVWARGANWIPDHSFPSMVSEKRYRERILDAWQLGCNMLRVWGGGIYESQEFYRQCDLHGILVWQDYPFACAYSPDDEEAQQILADEAYENIKRLRNHASLALWCGNNENQMMWHQKWGGKDKSPSRHHGAVFYEKVIPGVLAKADPSRPYIEGSPIWGAKEDDTADPNAGGSGDQHYWDVWHGRGDWRHYADSTARFCSEYGFAASCSREVWDTVLDPTDQLGSPAHLWHDKTGKGWETFVNYVKLHYPEPKSLDDWIYYSQLNQRDAIRFAIEHFRRSEFCKGSLIWQLNDCWPVQSWSLIDFKGNRKAAAHELRRLQNDHLFSIARDRDQVVLWAINDRSEPWDYDDSLQVVELSTGKVLREVTGSFVVKPYGREPVLDLSIEGLSGPDLILVAGTEGVMTWQLVAEPKAARLLEPCPLTISTHFDGFLWIQTQRPVVDLMLTSEGTPRAFRNNFLTLPAPGEKYVQIDGDVRDLRARSLAGIHPIRFVRGPLTD